ncbi:O-acetylhomoserine aminocarboxypropyltransferase/cysteine synthase [Humibacter sp. BT305]|nr:O-acetylhomoserine aminocarboxypropyltransferase/cysteine synthase [Humibacter sp. BT305]
MADEVGFATQQVHAGERLDGDAGARVTPIHLTAGFVFDDFDQARDRFHGDVEGFTYTRLGNPTTAAVERKLAALEHGVDAIAVASGQAAVTVALLALLRAGDRILASRSIYEGSRGLFRENFANLGIGVDFVDDPHDLAEWRARIRPETRVLFGESIPNPKNDVLDISGVADVAHDHGLPLVVDSTLATPYLVRPIDFGADVVVHSTSKFLAGHGASLGGAVIDGGRLDWAARPELFPQLTAPSAGLGGRSYVERFGDRAYAEYARSVIASRFGPTLSPLHAFLLQQGIETLSLRIERHSENALQVARWLEEQPEVASVDYSGLETSPYHGLAKRYLPRGQGSVFGFTLTGGEPAARAVVDAVTLFSRMTHLGDVRSLILHPATTTHSLLTGDELRANGIHPGLLRLSIGIEDVDDLLRDLAQALAASRRARLEVA